MLTNKEIIKSVYTYVNAINNNKLEGYTADGLKSKQFKEAWKMAEGLLFDESVKTPCGGTVTRDCVFNEMRENDVWLRTGDANITMITINALIADGYVDEAVKLNYAMFFECAIDMVWEAAEVEAGGVWAMTYSCKLFDMAVNASIEKGAISACQVAREIGCIESRVIRYVQERPELRVKLSENRKERNGLRSRTLIDRVKKYKALGLNVSQACKELGIKRHDYYHAYNHLD